MNRMRLIDADKINFEEVFGGQSDYAKDLRKAAQELIDSQPTAFDKEKVMEELNNSFERSVAEILDYIGSGYTIADFSLEKFKRKICCIVEKGGIEEE